MKHDVKQIIQIVQKTKGSMAEDQQWLEIMSIDGEKQKNNHLADS